MIDKHTEVHNILKDTLKHLNKVRHDNHIYWHYDKKKLTQVIQQYNDIIDHTNDFIAEVLK